MAASTGNMLEMQIIVLHPFLCLRHSGGDREQQSELHKTSFHDCEVYLVLIITGSEKLERPNGLGKETIRR